MNDATGKGVQEILVIIIVATFNAGRLSFMP